MKKGWLLLTASLLAATVFACPAMADDTTVAGTPRSETLVVESLDGVITNASQHNPYMSGTDFSAGLHQLVYSNLWEMDTINGVQIPDLAAELPRPLNDDYTKFEFKITQGIKWSDGVDFTANDVAFTFNKLLELGDQVPGGANLQSIVKSCTAVDDYTIQLETVDSRPRLSEDLGVTVWGNRYRIIPEHYWKDHDLTTDLYEDPIGTGPYTLDSYDPNGYWFCYKLRDDAEYSDVAVLTGKAPKAKYVVFTAYGTEEKKTMAMMNNEADILCDISPESWEVLMDNDKIACWLPEYPYGCFDDPCERGMSINCDVEPFNHKEVRWALALSLDMVQVSMDTFSGQMRVSPLCMPPTTFMSEAYHKDMRQKLIDYTWDDGYQPFDPDYAKELQAVLLDEGYDEVEGMSDDELVDLFGIGWWKHDEDKAAELMESAGCERDSDGYWTYNGKRITFEVPCPSGFETQSERLAYAVVSQWQEFGFDVTAQACEEGQFWSLEGPGDFTVGSYWPFCGVVKDLYSQLRGWHSKYYTPIGESGGNEDRYKSEKLDAILDEMEPLTDQDKLHELSEDALMTLADDVAWLPMFGTSKLVPTNSTYWTNYPDPENPYNGPWWWWSCFKFIENQFEPAA